mgnify:CR=1 FL=1
MNDEQIECCFCGHTIPVWQSNNPDPADTREDARCCMWCDDAIVLPARFAVGQIISDALSAVVQN